MKIAKKPHMAEQPFQDKITDYCDWLRLLWYHDQDSRRNNAGFPDLVIVGNATIFSELKSTTGRISLKQQEWHDRLISSGARAYIWRPEDWPEVQRILKALAERG